MGPSIDGLAREGDDQQKAQNVPLKHKTDLTRNIVWGKEGIFYAVLGKACREKLRPNKILASDDGGCW